MDKDLIAALLTISVGAGSVQVKGEDYLWDTFIKYRKRLTKLEKEETPPKQ